MQDACCLSESLPGRSEAEKGRKCQPSNKLSNGLTISDCLKRTMVMLSDASDLLDGMFPEKNGYDAQAGYHAPEIPA